jgi:predicted ABC-type ATPase
MHNPIFIIFAGCNGSGKSTYSKLLSNGIVVFDYDKTFLNYYDNLCDSELREQIALNKTTEDLERIIKNAFERKESIAFETNFNNVPKDWIQRAVFLGYKITIFFFVLDTIEKAQSRVLIRAKNNGHFVDDETIKFKWKEGYKNINLHYGLADNVIFIDNSKNNKIPETICEINKINATNFEIIQVVELPFYLKHRLPNIFNLLSTPTKDNN